MPSSYSPASLISSSALSSSRSASPLTSFYFLFLFPLFISSFYFPFSLPSHLTSLHVHFCFLSLTRRPLVISSNAISNAKDQFRRFVQVRQRRQILPFLQRRRLCNSLASRHILTPANTTSSSSSTCTSWPSNTKYSACCWNIHSPRHSPSSGAASSCPLPSHK